MAKIWGTTVSIDSFSAKDRKYLDGVLDKSPRARAIAVAEFAEAFDAVRANPGILPYRLEATGEGFAYVLHNRKALAKEDVPATPHSDVLEPRKTLMDPKPYTDYFTERFGGEPISLTPEQIREFQTPLDKTLPYNLEADYLLILKTLWIKGRR